MKILFAALALAVTACGQSDVAARTTVAMKLTGRVIDHASLIDATTEQALTDRLTALEAKTTDQVVVVTVTSLDGEPIETVAFNLANEWGLGRSDVDNGVLMLVAPHERKVRIETGRGIAGVLTDAEAGKIVRDMVSHFRRGEMEKGIEAGVRAIDRELSEDPARPALLRKDEPWPA